MAAMMKALVKQGFISQNAADDALAQRNALRESIAAARARADQTRRSAGKGDLPASSRATWSRSTSIPTCAACSIR